MLPDVLEDIADVPPPEALPPAPRKSELAMRADEEERQRGKDEEEVAVLGIPGTDEIAGLSLMPEGLVVFAPPEKPVGGELGAFESLDARLYEKMRALQEVVQPYEARKKKEEEPQDPFDTSGPIIVPPGEFLAIEALPLR